MATNVASYPATDLQSLINRLLKDARSSKDQTDQMLSCLSELAKMALSLGETWKVRPFGSAANGFCTQLSDLDVTCFDSAEGTSKLPAVAALRKMQPMLEASGRFEITEAIPGARIPILRVRFEEKLNMDLSFQNTDPLLNTQMLRAYAQLGSTVRNLGILVKLWANSEGVCGAKDGHLSSYSLILMTIYFLQVDTYVKMPCFPVWQFNGKKHIPECAKTKWDPPLPVHMLLHRFFEFYATQHMWGYEVVSPRVGQRYNVRDSCFDSLPGRECSDLIQIEDPFILTRNLNCVLGREQQQLLCDKILSAHTELQNGRIPHGLMVATLSLRQHHVRATPTIGTGEIRAAEIRQQAKTPGIQSGESTRKVKNGKANHNPDFPHEPEQEPNQRRSEGDVHAQKKSGKSQHGFSTIPGFQHMYSSQKDVSLGNGLNMSFDHGKASPMGDEHQVDAPMPDCMPATKLFATKFFQKGEDGDELQDGMTWSL